MIWFDQDPNRDLAAMARQAARYYEKKYGTRPTACLFHPALAQGAPEEVDGMALRPSRGILPSHLWLGVE